MITYLRVTLHFSTYASLMVSSLVLKVLLLYYFNTLLAMYYTSSVKINERDKI